MYRVRCVNQHCWKNTRCLTDQKFWNRWYYSKHQICICISFAGYWDHWTVAFFFAMIPLVVCFILRLLLSVSSSAVNGAQIGLIYSDRLDQNISLLFPDEVLFLCFGLMFYCMMKFLPTRLKVPDKMFLQTSESILFLPSCVGSRRNHASLYLYQA